MLITQQLFEAILKRCPEGENQAGWMANEFNRIHSIQDQIQKAEKEVSEEKAKHANNIKIIYGKIDTIREGCSHYLWNHIPDASGNNDSQDICNICGKLEEKVPKLSVLAYTNRINRQFQPLWDALACTQETDEK